MKIRWRRIFCGVLLVVAGFGAGPLRADDLPDANGITSPSIATSLPNNGDPGGVRKWLGQRGITYNVIYTNDVLSNLSGGNKRGTIDQGKLEGQLTVDLAKLADWQDLTFYANAFQIHNTGRIRRDYVGGMNTIAAIEATPATRLSNCGSSGNFSAALPVSEWASSLPTANSSSATSATSSCRPTGRPSRRAICRAADRPIHCPRSARGRNSTTARIRRSCWPFSTAIPPGPALAIPIPATATVSISDCAIRP